MFIELTDHLRCPEDHEESFLVLLPDQGSPVGPSSSRVLWIRPEWPPGEALGHVEKFLSTEE